MPYAKYTITVPESVWISQVSKKHPETRFRVLAASANTASGNAQIEVVGGDPESVCDEIQEYDSVIDLTIFETKDGMSRIQVETTTPLLLTSLQDSGVPLQMPFEVSNGQMSLEFIVPHETLSELGKTLDKLGIQYSVERIQQDFKSESLLTERQQWVLNQAIEHGYYDTPRQITLVDLADELDIAKSTCSEILHRAEEQILKEYRRDDRDRSPNIPIISD